MPVKRIARVMNREPGEQAARFRIVLIAKRSHSQQQTRERRQQVTVRGSQLKVVDTLRLVGLKRRTRPASASAALRQALSPAL